MEKAPRNLDVQKLANVADVLKTIAHPVRLEILEILEVAEPKSVGELQQGLKTAVEQSMLSHHLIKMRDHGILTSHKEGKHMYYALKDRSILKIFDCMEQCDFL
ncbi:MAG: ArsR/SmtB family transcription factor [Luteibaculum sp.]